MAFTQTQVRKLAGKLPERFVKTRTERGTTLSYVEGWHVIDEANRVFGFDGWDRETVSAECVWQDARIPPKACSYAVRVRIKVRAGKTLVSREGTGIGHGSGATLGEAHESALKEAETDATKRALVTFGNRFGLALYDKEQNGVQRAKPARSEAGAAPMVWTLITGKAQPQVCETPHRFCAAAKEALHQAPSLAELEALWTANAPTIAQLRAVEPQLRTRNGTHYADLLESLSRQQRSALQAAFEKPLAATPAAEGHTDTVPAPAAPTGVDEPAPARLHIVPSTASVAEPLAAARPPLGTVVPPAPDGRAAGTFTAPRRMRDPNHLKRVAALPCLVCGRSPSHAHQLRFAQFRSLGSKPSDEWTVPLCPIHHRALHDAGHEAEWWQATGIDAKAEAERLWRTTRGPEPGTSTALQAAAVEGALVADEPEQAPKPPPVDDQGQPIPVNLQAGSADRS
jgi:DNA recombination protein Rad52